MNRVTLFVVALAILAGIGVVFLMFQDSSTAPPSDAGAEPSTNTSASVNASADRTDASKIKPELEAQIITPKPVIEPHASARDAGIAGIVQNEAGTRIEGAACELFEDTGAIKDRSQEGELVANQTSSSEGTFFFERDTLSLAERYVLKVSHGTYMTERKVIDVKKNDIVTVTLRLGTAVAGCVRTAAGQPIAGATVTVFDMSQGTLDPNGSVETFAQTDDTGQYTAPQLCAGPKRIRASAAGYATVDRQGLQIEQGTPLSGIDFNLNGGGGISGHVVAQDGTPIGGAWVRAQPIRIGAKEPVGERPTAARREAPRDRGLATAASGKSDEAAVEDEAGRIGAAAAQNGTEMSEATAHLMMKEKEGATKAASGNLKRSFVPPQQAAMTVLTVRTDSGGAFNIAGAEIGSYIVSVTAAGYLAPQQQTVESPSEGIRFICKPNGRVEGRVVDDETGKPVAPFTLAITTAPDEVLIPSHTKRPFGPPRFKDGRFEYIDVKPGRFWLVAEAPGYAGGRSEEIVVSQGERLEGVEIRLVRGATIKGRVVDAKGSPVASATVQPDPASLTGNGPAGRLFSVLFASMRRDISDVKTDADGRFSIPGMLSGSYTLTVRHPDFGPETTSAFTVPASGEVNQPDITLARGATVRGRVKLPDGRPDAKAMVQVERVGGTTSLSAHQSVYTDSDGRFEVTGLALGQYQVRVAQRNGQTDFGQLFIALKNPNVFTLSEGEVKEMDL